jgi:hypothetical protein
MGVYGTGAGGIPSGIVAQGSLAMARSNSKSSMVNLMTGTRASSTWFLGFSALRFSITLVLHRVGVQGSDVLVFFWLGEHDLEG